MQNFVIGTLPKGVQEALGMGLSNLKIATVTDKVGIVSDDVSTPLRAPEGSPLGGQVARPQGAPIPPFATIIVDTSAFTEATTDIFCNIGDGSGVHKNGCFSCNTGSTNEAFPIIGSATCNQYETLINKLCNSPLTLGALKVEVSKAATNSSANSTLELPESIKYSRKNILGDGPTGTVHISLFEKDENYPNPSKKYTTVALTNEAALLDSDTQWTVSNLVGGRIYKFIIFTGVQG